MKVTQPPASPGRDNRGKGAPPATPPRSPSERTDQPKAPPADHDLSEAAQLVQTATEAVHAAPDANRAKVAALKKAVQEGSYETDAAEIAERLVDEHVKTKLD